MPEPRASAVVEPSTALSAAARRVLEARYLRRDDAGVIVETPAECFARVARAVAAAEARWGGRKAAAEWGGRFEAAMAALEFLPSSPILMNAGTAVDLLAACHVLPVPDSVDGIFDVLALMARIQRAGGGTGFSFSRLRPRGDPVRTQGGAASGPVAFLRVFDAATETIRAGGRRRGANMGVLRVDHPDIVEFVDAKREPGRLANFNCSVGCTDAFMAAAAAGAGVELRHPATGRVAGVVSAAELLGRIAAAAWATGEPGCLFLDAIERANPTPALGAIEATNPCGEVPLLPYEACVLGSVNLARCLEPADGASMDWTRLRALVHLGVRFLDDVLLVAGWPAPAVARAVAATRKIGLGVMGFAEACARLGVAYDDPRAPLLAERLARFIQQEAREASAALARQRGPFPAWERSVHAAGPPLRHAAVTAIAPTGSLSLIAGTTSGIEPPFALAYTQAPVLRGVRLALESPVLAAVADRTGVPLAELAARIAARGRLARPEGLPPGTAPLLRTALEIAPAAHLAVQAAFQRHVDGAVAKTVNLPAAATPADVAAVFRAAWAAGCKGVTVYRDGSRSDQLLRAGLDPCAVCAGAPHPAEP